MRILTFTISLFLLFWANTLQAQTDSVKAQAKQAAESARLKMGEGNVRMAIQNIDVTRFPEVKLIVEAVKANGTVLDTLNPKEFSVVENGVTKRVISIEKISFKESIPIDFVFVLDVTATMGSYINAIRNNIEKFVGNVTAKGIDYRVGLVLFSDVVEKVYNPTDNVKDFNKWLTGVYATGGGDDKENALEALSDMSKMKFRQAANKVAIIITDAPYHQKGERGQGRTMQTTESIIQTMKDNSIRLFSIVPPVLQDYRTVTEGARGSMFDISRPFATILDDYSTQLTNLFAITYRSDKTAIPDSLSVGIIDEQKREIVKKIIPLVELGRKLIIENLLFPTNSSTLPDSVYELELLKEFLMNRPKVSVRIEGHTDSRGSKVLNRKLSVLRAEAVRQYLIKKGVDQSRLESAGLGDSKPIASNATDFGRRLNRRTEVIIIGK
jgi:outer membrane protein OmpA-like peptidoglycan-associated protein